MQQPVLRLEMASFKICIMYNSSFMIFDMSNGQF